MANLGGQQVGQAETHGAVVASLRDTINRVRGADNRPPNARSLRDLWSCYRRAKSVMEAQAAEIARLEGLLQAARSSGVSAVPPAPSTQVLAQPTSGVGVQTNAADIPCSPASRPPTTDPIRIIRDDLTRALSAAALVVNASPTTIAIHNLPAGWVRERLLEQRVRAVERSAGSFGPVTDKGPSGTGCWMKTAVGSAGDLYDSVNWRNTVRPNPNGTNGLPGGQKIGYPVKLHHLAVVAAGRGQDLLAVAKVSPGGYRYEVSHLCNNAKCFNPDHIRVETKLANDARKACAKSSQLLLDGSVMNPCTHDQEFGWKCVMPIYEGSASGPAYYEAQPNGRGWKATLKRRLRRSE